MRLCCSVLAAVLALALSTGATAAALSDTVDGRAGLTYFDLLREVVLDLELEPGGAARGGAPIPFRHLADPSCPCDPPEAVFIDSADPLPLRSGGKGRLLVLAHVSDEGWNVGGTTLLALFDLDASPRLVDVADVGLDERVVFAGRPLLELGPGDQAALVDSSHWNSNQTYLTTLMVFAPAGRLALIGDVFTFSDRDCGYERVQSPAFQTVAETGRRYAGIRVQVKDEVAATGDADCGGDPVAPSSKTVEATYRWDEAAGAFAPDTDALKRLEEESAERF